VKLAHGAERFNANRMLGFAAEDGQCFTCKFFSCLASPRTVKLRFRQNEAYSPAVLIVFLTNVSGRCLVLVELASQS